MARNMNKRQITALYERLSHDDELQGESNSITKTMPHSMDSPTLSIIPMTASAAHASTVPVFRE